MILWGTLLTIYYRRRQETFDLRTDQRSPHEYETMACPAMSRDEEVLLLVLPHVTDSFHIRVPSSRYRHLTLATIDDCGRFISFVQYRDDPRVTRPITCSVQAWEQPHDFPHKIQLL